MYHIVIRTSLGQKERAREEVFEQTQCITRVWTGKALQLNKRYAHLVHGLDPTLIDLSKDDLKLIREAGTRYQDW